MVVFHMADITDMTQLSSTVILLQSFVLFLFLSGLVYSCTGFLLNKWTEMMCEG